MSVNLVGVGTVVEGTVESKIPRTSIETDHFFWILYQSEVYFNPVLVAYFLDYCASQNRLGKCPLRKPSSKEGGRVCTEKAVIQPTALVPNIRVEYLALSFRQHDEGDSHA
jgi:hypothetical protein